MGAAPNCSGAAVAMADALQALLAVPCPPSCRPLLQHIQHALQQLQFLDEGTLSEFVIVP